MTEIIHGPDGKKKISCECGALIPISRKVECSECGSIFVVEVVQKAFEDGKWEAE